MPQAANIVLADALVTPVNHTFIPVGPDSNGVQWYEDQSRPADIGFWRISVDVRKPLPPAAGSVSTGRVNRVIISLHEPQLETVGNVVGGFVPAPQVAYISRSKVEFLLPERGVLQERKDMRKMTMNLLADSQIVAAVEQLQRIT